MSGELADELTDGDIAALIALHERADSTERSEPARRKTVAALRLLQALHPNSEGK